MKLFTKLALVSAVAVSSNAMAMQAMDDAALSATTGQDGISIGIAASEIHIDKVHVFDGDGLSTSATPAGAANSGVISIADITLTANANALTSGNLADLVIDAEGGTTPYLNIAASVAGMDITMGPITVNDATGSAGAYVAGGAATEATILESLTLSTGATTANIQLGNAPQGAMIVLAGAMTGGLTISDLSLKDNSTNGQGSIGVESIRVTDTGTTDTLNIGADINVTTAGLKVVAMKTGTDMYIKGVSLGSAAGKIGDIAVSNVTTSHMVNGAATAGAVITISGH